MEDEREYVSVTSGRRTGGKVGEESDVREVEGQEIGKNRRTLTVQRGTMP